MKYLQSLFAAVDAPENVPKVDLSDSTVTNIFNAALVFAGILAVIFIIVGGIQYTLSQGDANKIGQAKNTLLYSIVGLIIVASAFIIVNFVIGKF